MERYPALPITTYTSTGELIRELLKMERSRTCVRCTDMDSHTIGSLQRQLREREQDVATLRDAIVFARYEILEARKSAIAADDHLRRAVGGIDREDPLDWIC